MRSSSNPSFCIARITAARCRFTVQLASIPAWNDDAHVVENRRLYREKFARVLPILREVMDVEMPEASFFLWPKVGDDERFTRELFERQHVTTLPGSYIARDIPSGNPGRGRVRLSLVATVPRVRRGGVSASSNISVTADALTSRDDLR